MASTSQRARFLLEQTVPELQELLIKGLFSQDEISSIARKRSDFEHLLNARGAVIYDFVRYISYEQTLDKLKAKRIKRFGARNLVYNGQRRLFSLFERATQKFPRDLRLWMLYLRYARSVRAHKRVGKLLTALLRLHPSNADLWIVAARFTAYEQDDLNSGRSYLQRGMRFTPKEKRLWLELIGLELSFVQKASTQLENLGVKSSTNNTMIDTEQDSSYFDERALKQMSSTPVMSGGIVRAVFDAAMAEFDNDESLAAEIFYRIAEFPLLKCTQSLLNHILEYLNQLHPTSSSTIACMFKLPTVGVNPTSPDFPLAIAQSIQVIYPVLENEDAVALEVAEKVGPSLFKLQSNRGDDPDVQEALQITLDQTLKILAGGDRLLLFASHIEALEVNEPVSILIGNHMEMTVS